MSSLQTAPDPLSRTSTLQRPHNYEILPPEIWVAIIQHCPRATQRSCLSLSKGFHHHTLPLLFRNIIVPFGAWEVWAASINPRAVGVEDLRKLDVTRSRRSWDILRRITADPSFAIMIRSLEIEAYMQVSSPGVFEKCHLVEAIRHLPKLERLCWNGVTPSPCSEVLDALAESCPRLQSLTMPMLSYVSLPFWKLRGLRRLAFHWQRENILEPLLDTYEDVKLDKATFPDMRDLYLFSITPARVVSLCSCLDQLTHLHLLYIRNMDNLHGLLGSLPRIESLTLQTLQGELLLEALQHGPISLPRLTQFKINGGESELIQSFSDVTTLAEVIRGIPSLQCFDCSFYVPHEYLEVMSSAILSLKCLRVLGLQIGDPVVHRYDARDLFRQMPTQLDALALVLSTGPLDGYELTELWTRCQSLRYFYLFTWRDVAVTVEDLACEGQSLELVGLNNAFHSVERTGSNVTLSERWSNRKLEFRGTDDFGCPEWEWLMREKMIPW